jgi:hypothetical protein
MMRRLREGLIRLLLPALLAGCSEAGDSAGSAVEVPAAPTVQVASQAPSGNPARQAEVCPKPASGLYPAAPAEPASIPWNRWLLDCVPPLRNGRGDRWPLVFWHGPQWQGITDADLAAFAERGMVPVVRLDRDAIPQALRLQALGLPVIVLEGKRRNWPYDLAGEGDPVWLDEPGVQVRQPDPLRLDLWAKGADEIRGVLRAFRDAGVQVDAAWLDYEGQPSVQDYQTLLAAEQARSKLPQAALASPAAFYRYRRQLWLQLMSAYVAAPIREFYPAASVTNWIAMLSSPEVPVVSWDNWPQPDLSASLFTATNPVAYGIDSAFWAVWPVEQQPDRGGVDRAYLHLLLRQPSVDAFQRTRKAPYLHAVPWVARWVRDLADRETPVMSRQAYREALRHLWLRGMAGMQVFNPLRRSHPAESLAEVQDAVAVYDEMLAQRELLDEGQVMNYAVPAPTAQGLLWSGLRNGQTAVVRLYPLGDQAPAFLRLTVWTDQEVLLPVSEGGSSYRIERGGEGEGPRVLLLPAPA